MNYRIQAIVFQLGLEAGIVSRGEITRWADSILESEEPYDDWLGSLATCQNLPYHQILTLLGSVPGDVVSYEELWSPLKEFISKKLEDGKLSPEKAVSTLHGRFRDGFLPEAVEERLLLFYAEYDAVHEGFVKKAEVDADVIRYFAEPNKPALVPDEHWTGG